MAGTRRIVSSSMSMSVVVIFALAAAGPGVVRCQPGSTHTGAPLLVKLQEFARGALGVQTMQNSYYASSSTTTTSVNGSLALDRLAQDVASRLQSRFRVARNLQSAARKAYEQGRTSESETLCCQVSRYAVVFDSRFNTTVTPTRSCDRISATADSRRSTISVSFRNAAASNLAEVPEVKFQYYGSEEGYATIFPGFNTSDCSSYDPRYRPWYVAGAVPASKDVLVVMDVSGSMGNIVSGTGRTRLDLAKEAVLSILSVLSDKDRITILPFASTPVNIAPATSNMSCFNDMLGQATPYNKQLLRHHVGRLLAGGATFYGTAITRAFQIYSNTAAIPGRDRVILFLSDGAPSEQQSSILQRQEVGAKEFGYQIVILTYAMGINVKSGEGILQNMAYQRYQNLPPGATPAPGEYRLIDNFQNLRGSLTRFYSFFASEDTSSSAIFTNPYYDAFGLGVILTVAAPVYTFSSSNIPTLRGVVGVDITVTDLFGDIAYFSDDEHQYAFMVNTDGQAILHPLLNQPVDLLSDPIFQDITLLEVDDTFRQLVYYEMRNGTAGRAVINATRYLTIGISQYEGTRAVMVLSEYFWKPVAGTSFVVCVVLNLDSAREVGTIIPQPPPTANTVYHRLDLITTTVRKCNQFGRVATGDASAVKFSPEAFLDPAHYLNVPENRTAISKYLAYLGGTSRSNPYFKPTVINSVRLTALLDTVWTAGAGQQYSQSVVWRYIGTIDGVFRLLPGTQLPTSYDHLKRGWFTRSINNPSQLTLSSPYLDAFGAGFVVTLGTTVTQSSDQSSTSAVGAVMAMDFTLGYLSEVLQQLYAECTQIRCIIIDSSGYLVFHPDFLTETTSPEWVHLGHKEPFVTRDLIAKGVLQKQNCARYDSFKRHVTYKMALPGGSTSFSARTSCSFTTLDYNFEQVQNSNIYVGFLSHASCSRANGNYYQSTCLCPTYNGLGQCSQITTPACECPCTVDLPYYPCNNSFPAQGRQYDVCPAEIFALPVVPRKAGSVSGLETCFNGKCTTIGKSSTCRAIVGCDWCSRDSNLLELDTAYCSTDCFCFQGVLGRKNPNAGCDQEFNPSRSGGDAGVSGPSVILQLIYCALILIGTPVTYML